MPAWGHSEVWAWLTRPFPAGVEVKTTRHGWRLSVIVVPGPRAQLRRGRDGWVHSGDVPTSARWIDERLCRELRTGELVQRREGHLTVIVGRAGRGRRLRLAEWLVDRGASPSPWAELAAATWGRTESEVVVDPTGRAGVALADDWRQGARLVAASRDLAEAEPNLWALQGTPGWAEALRLHLEHPRPSGALGQVLAAGLRPGPGALPVLDAGLERGAPNLVAALLHALRRFDPDCAEPRLLDVVQGRHRCLRGRSLGERMALRRQALQSLARVGKGQTLGVLRRLSERAGLWAPLARSAQTAIVSIEARNPERARGQVSVMEAPGEGAVSHPWE